MRLCPQQRAAAGAERLAYETARVVAVRNVGVGDMWVSAQTGTRDLVELNLLRSGNEIVASLRAECNLCSLLAPGEGLLVGSSAGALLLVDSNCAESKCIDSRRFRVNAGPVRSPTC